MKILSSYCNETLHQIFIDLTLKTEQEGIKKNLLKFIYFFYTEYVKEGIQWEPVQYVIFYIFKFLFLIFRLTINHV